MTKGTKKTVSAAVSRHCLKNEKTPRAFSYLCKGVLGFFDFALDEHKLKFLEDWKTIEGTRPLKN